MIILHLILHSAVHTYDFHIFITSSSSFHGVYNEPIQRPDPGWLVNLRRSRPILQRWPDHSTATQATEINTLDHITGKVIDVSRTHIPLKTLMIPLKRVKLRGVV